MTAAFGILFWPSLAAGLAIWWMMFRQKISKRWVPTVAWFALALTCLPVFGLFLWFMNGSELIQIDQNTFFIALGLVLLRCLPVVPTSRKGAWGLLILGVGGIAFGSWHLIGDYAFPREHFDGVVQRIGKERPRSPNYYVRIDGRRFSVTRDTLPTLNVGDHVRVEYGLGSGTIFHIERASSAGLT